MVKIAVSEKRNTRLQQFQLNEQTMVTTWGTIKVNKSHFFPSSFQIRTPKHTVYIDPVEISDGDKADYIFITHAHPDHLNLETIAQLYKSGTTIVCPKGVLKKLKKQGYLPRLIRPGETMVLGDIVCRAVGAYNVKNVFLWIKAHPKSKQNVGYVLTLEGGERIYHAGDTDYIPEMDGLKDIDLAMIPIGGDNLTMNMAEATKVINTTKPKVVIPMHYEFKDRPSQSSLENQLNEDIEVRLMH
ncbi:MBL fold metallo-hydrolase [Spongiimicrobium sp. 3-5]|uniref:MBL fold metallo-hydrolase n=1 Tax=Spongiimicrobium sp. 3-5 TaxID=3332596 RepID=UPI00397F3C05